MKKRILSIVALSAMTLSLTACQFISDYFSNFINYGGEDSFNQIVASSHQPISDVSTPPAGDIRTSHASYTYMDYVSNSIYPFSCTPSLGNANLLVIPVWFNDSNQFIKDSHKETVRDEIFDIYFGDTDVTGWHSVKTYYEEESHGKLTLSGTVSEWYEVNKSYTYYATDEPSEISGAPKTTSLVETATEWYFETHNDEKRTDYDCDNDGYLDGVMLIYAAPDYNTLSRDSYSNLWAFCYWTQDYESQSFSNPGVNAFFWASYDFMYGRDIAYSHTGSRYGAGDTSHCNLDAHTYIHEMGHMFGLEDYYDYSSYDYSPAGGFCMQDYNVGGHDPFSSFALGWGQAYIPTETINIDLKPFVTSGEMILLTPSWNSYNSPFDEYILLEYYTDQSLNELDSTYSYMSTYGKQYPMGTKEYGIRVWHVDARLLYTATGAFSEKRITSNPKIASGRVVNLTSNTYDDGSDYARQYVSPLAQDPNASGYNAIYAQYNLLHLIRNKSNANTKPRDYFDGSSLFKTGDSFSMSSFAKQFVNSGKLNSKTDLGFTFKVNACNNTYASITVTKV